MIKIIVGEYKKTRYFETVPTPDRIKKLPILAFDLFDFDLLTFFYVSLADFDGTLPTSAFSPSLLVYPICAFF